jgi:ketosteroid isomerase-like protein
MSGSSPASIVRTFVEYVNEGDFEGIASLLSERVKFTDIRGRVYREKDFMADYVRNFPDYKILVHHILQGGQGAAIVGKTAGSHVPPGIERQETLVWTAEVRDGLITEWRIYSDAEYAARS